MIATITRPQQSPVGFRIITGLALTLAVVLVLVGSSLYSNLRTERDANWVWAKTREAAGSGAVASQLGEVKASLSQYALSENQGDLRAVQDALQKLGNVVALLATEPEVARATGRIQELAATYSSAVAKALKLIELRRIEASRLAYSATELRTTFSAISRAEMRSPNGLDDKTTILRLMEAFHNSLSFANRFLASRDPSDAEVARAELQVLEVRFQEISAAAATAQIQRFIGAVPVPLKAYSAGLVAVIDATERFGAATAERQKAALALRELTDQTVRTATEYRHTALATTISRLREQFWIQVAGFTAALVVFLLITRMVMLRVIRPIRDITAALRGLAGGELETQVPHGEDRSEIGQMARDAEIFRANMARVAMLEFEKGEQQRARETRVRRIEHLNASFEKNIGGLIRSLSGAAVAMTETAERMFEASDMMNSRSGSVAAAAVQSSSQIQLVAASTEEFAYTIEDISKEVSRAAEMAGSAAAGAAATGENIHQLASRAKQIGHIASFVSDVASQTSLLALNATIEAARAGVAGRGFAVVASEVKELACQTAKATGEIGQSIADVQNATVETISAIQEIASAVQTIDEAGQAVWAAVRGQEGSVREIAENLSSAALGTQQVTADLDDLRRAAADTGTSAAAVLDAARQLGRGADELRDEVQHFIAEVRAA